MNVQYSLDEIDSLLLKSALRTQELSQTKSRLIEEIKVCRTSIAERRSSIDTMHRNIKKLEEDISVKQNTIMHYKENAKRIKASNNLLLHYEQTLKAELETRKASYNHDSEVYEERISSCQKTFQSYKEHYLQNPHAEKLLMLQAETEEVRCRIRAWDDQITMKQRELDRLTGPTMNTSFAEKLPDSDFVQPDITEQEVQPEHEKNEDSDSSIDISTLHLKQKANDHKTFVDVNAEETGVQNEVQDSPTCDASHEKEDEALWSYPQLNEQSQPDEMNTEEQDQETSQQDHVLEQEPTDSDVRSVLEEEMQEGGGLDEENAPAEEDNQKAAVFPETSSDEANPQPVPGIATVPSSPTFTFSPTSSPHQGTSDTKSPAFLFPLISRKSTPGFPAFGFGAGSSQDEDSSFAFPGSLFHDKKATEEKPSDCHKLLFDQPEQSEDFRFAFTAKSPHSGSEENTKNDFPFSFNF